MAKGSRLITHLKRLNAVNEPLKLFMENVEGLRAKLAAVLWQFPPSFKKNIKKLKVFLKILKQSGSRHVFEFRNISWFDDEVYSLMKEYNACLCIAHSGERYPCLKEITADFIYLRFHGAGSLYASNYSGEELKSWVQFIRHYSRGRQAKDIFAFFNNDAYGYAVNNALAFRKLLIKK